MKKYIALTFSFVFCLIGLTAQAFPDLQVGTLEFKAADYLRDNNIINGYPDGTFGGEKMVNRAEAAKFLLLAGGLSIPDIVNDNPFPDVDKYTWYAPYVYEASKQSIIAGYPNGLYQPAATVNRAEFTKMLSETFSVNENLPHTYQDVDRTLWFEKYVGFADVYDLFPHNNEDNFNAGDQLTRNEVAVAIYQYLKSQKISENQEPSRVVFDKVNQGVVYPTGVTKTYEVVRPFLLSENEKAEIMFNGQPLDVIDSRFSNDKGLVFMVDSLGPKNTAFRMYIYDLQDQGLHPICLDECKEAMVFSIIENLEFEWTDENEILLKYQNPLTENMEIFMSQSRLFPWKVEVLDQQDPTVSCESVIPDELRQLRDEFEVQLASNSSTTDTSIVISNHIDRLDTLINQYHEELLQIASVEDRPFVQESHQIWLAEREQMIADMRADREEGGGTIQPVQNGMNLVNFIDERAMNLYEEIQATRAPVDADSCDF